MALTQLDSHSWGSNPFILGWLCGRINEDARVLEIGPGATPFPRANVIVDQCPRDGIEIVQCDVLRNDLPFPDKSFDFVYSRHLLEDIWNPFRVLAEMQRVAKAGYIETPSPLAELCRGVDGDAPVYRGYHHHAYIVWVDNGVLKFIHKYPIVEYTEFSDAELEGLLRIDTRYWNSYFAWQDNIRWENLQSPVDFEMTRDYTNILKGAISQSRKATDEFFANVMKVKLNIIQRVKRDQP